MNWAVIKSKLCRLMATASLLLGGTMVTAAATGTMPLWAALLGIFAAIVLLNTACGALLEPPAQPEAKPAATPYQRGTVQLRVVRGGHAA